ncbi:MAG: hypothetical protein WBH10_03660 [Allopontixanthobacter sediminis]
MTTSPALMARHKRWVANHFKGKVKELDYQLMTLVDACDHSLALFTASAETAAGNGAAVTYSFSALANVVQTMKDAVKTVTGHQLNWSDINALRHGAFLHAARNAITHDGNPVVSAWADGRYYVPAKIIRIGRQGEIITIDPPLDDIRTVCLAFASDFCGLVSNALTGVVGEPDLAGSIFDIADLDEFFAESLIIPDSVKAIFASNRDQVVAEMESTIHDPTSDTITMLAELALRCEARLRV